VCGELVILAEGVLQRRLANRWEGAKLRRRMGILFRLIAHLLLTLARLAGPGGVRAVAAESLAVKHQLLIMKRSRRRGPNLTGWDRLILGFCTVLVSPRRLGKIAVILKTSTLLRLHRALVKRKYHLLYGVKRRCRSGPKGPSRELIDAVVEMKRRNPYFGCRKIAEQIASAFGIEINKDVVRRILIRYYRPAPSGDGPSWLAAIGHAKDSLWSVDLFRCESILLKSYWVMAVMDVYTRRIIGFGVGAANLDGIQVCRMFNRAIAQQTLPKHLSSDNDPLFRFHRWLANLRVLEVDEIKTGRGTPRSHAFVERLIGTIRREFSTGHCFGARAISSSSWKPNRRITTGIAVTPDWPGSRRLRGAVHFRLRPHASIRITGADTATASFKPRLPPELEFATHTLAAAIW
jgi:putative transposase